MATLNSKSRMSMKLLIDTKSQTVLLAEADKDFVDFLFTQMSLPLGRVISLLSCSGMVGCVGKVYQSIENLSRTYIQPNVPFLHSAAPKIAADDDHNNGGVVLFIMLPKKEEGLPAGTKIYICPELANTYSSSNICHRYVARDYTVACPYCNSTMSTDATVVEASKKKDGDRQGEGEGAFVKGVVTYMLMDGLALKLLKLTPQ